MKKVILYCLLFVAAISYGQKSSQQQFIQFMLPKINQANAHVLDLRHHLQYLYDLYQHEQPLSDSAKDWLLKIAHDYRLKSPDFLHNASWLQLLRRVDIMPVSLVLAQAINESGWGRSYFAKKGNNYFGQWCMRPGCGIVPRRRAPKARHEVKKYPTALNSVQDYLFNINTNRSYHKLRDLRYQLRVNRQLLSGIVLATGLRHYSQLGAKYITIMQEIINKYNLGQYDIG